MSTDDIYKVVGKAEVAANLKRIDVNKFIKELKSREIVWNYKLPGHTNQRRIEYENFARAMNSTGKCSTTNCQLVNLGSRHICKAKRYKHM